uniref:NAD(P)-binding protein n=1 Tax=Psilocybe cubensis TaxID=181762 RepID=A0A8H8CF24_PSICU
MAPKSNHSSRNGSPLRPAFAGTSSYTPDTMSVADELHPVIHAGRVALVTGAASGIGRAAAIEFAKLGLKVAIADISEDALTEVGKTLSAIVGEPNVLVVPTDVSKLDQVRALRDRVYEAWGEVAVLMNNAGIGLKGTSWEGLDNWHKIFEVNVFGGNAAYNASKAAVKSLTEGLAHELRERSGSNMTAHLFIPGWTFTSLTSPTPSNPSTKPAGAWTPEETVLYMLDKVRSTGDFYILVPDNETKREVDQLRIMWGAADVAEGRPALSRWDANWKALYEEYVREGLAQLE